MRGLVRRSAAVGTLAAVLILVIVPGVAAAQEVDAGALEAHIGEDPWSLELSDSTGGRVLSEHPGTGSGPTGTLGLRTSEGWVHATRVIDSSASGDGFRATLATTDPEYSLEVELKPDADGVISLAASVDGPPEDVEAVGIGFEADPEERYMGFGERSNQVDQAGGTVENYVADGPYQEAEYFLISSYVPDWGLREDRADATYFPIPWLLSSEGYGVLVDNPETSLFRLRSDSADGWSVEVTPAPPDEPGADLAPPVTELRMRFFAGPEPADALRRYSAAVGRQPAAAAPWLYGPWYQPGDEAAELRALRDADAPVSALQTYTHYLPCGDQNTAVERERTAAAHRGGVAITTYFNPMVCERYAEAFEPAVAAGALTETRAGEPYTYSYSARPEDRFVVGQYDFFEPAARELFAGLLLEAVDDGYDGWMEDFGEYTPLDSVSAGTTDGTRAHNEYPRRYHCAAYDAIADAKRPVIRFQRSGWTGAARCAQVVWGGDPTTGWGFDGLRSSVSQALSMGLSGVGIWGSDIGGFFGIGPNQLTPELLKRWVQFGAVSGVMRTQRNGVSIPSRPRPQVTDPDQIDNWRRYTKLRTQLYPYIRAAERQYARSGMPLMRHLMLPYPDDPRAAGIEDQFMLGDEILAAPVVDPGVEERDAYLPAGRWIDLWRSARYSAADGSIALTRPRVLAGSQDVTVPAPLDELPLFVRSGGVIPMLPPGVDTLAPDRGSKRLTSLADVRGRLRLLAFPDGRRSGSLGTGGTWVSVVRAGTWRLSLRAPQRTRFSLQAALGSGSASAPCAVSANGKRLPASRWRFNRRTKVLTAEVAGRTVTLRTRAKRCG